MSFIKYFLGEDLLMNEAIMLEERKNRDFVQVYRENMKELRWLMINHPSASSILFFIMEHMDGKNALCCAHSVIADYFEISERTVSRNVKILKDNGFIDILKSGTTNVYVINPEVAWSSWNNQKAYAKFEGNILINKKENKDYYYRSQFDRFKALRERENIK